MGSLSVFNRLCADGSGILSQSVTPRGPVAQLRAGGGNVAATPPSPTLPIWLSVTQTAWP